MKRRNSHITLSDIAGKLRVSSVTVSKALRDHPDISDDMKTRVRKVAQELRYSPNIIARSLSARRSNMIGLVVPKIAHFFFGSVIEGVYDAAFASNYETILTVSQENPERERKHLETLVSMRVDGILISISQATGDPEIFRWIKKMGVPLLFIDRKPYPRLPGFSSIVADDKGGSFTAVDHAIKLGYRKVGYVGGNENINIGKERIEGVRAALEYHGLALESRWCAPGGFGKADGFQGLMTLHQRGELPEFIFALTYPIAIGVYEAAKQLRLRIPEDIDLMCFGDSDVNHILSPAMSCVVQPSCELGTKSVELMLKMLASPDPMPEQHIVLRTEMRLRETCMEKKRTLTPRAS